MKVRKGGDREWEAWDYHHELKSDKSVNETINKCKNGKKQKYRKGKEKWLRSAPRLRIY